MQYLDVNRPDEEVMCKASDLKKGGKCYLSYIKNNMFLVHGRKICNAGFPNFWETDDTMELTADDRTKNCVKN
jgi:hypothetical protein